MNEYKGFARGISDTFVAELAEGRFAGLRQAALRLHLDVQIREKYINIYSGGCSVPNLREIAGNRYEASIHWKFLQGVHLPGRPKVEGDYRCYSADDAFIGAYILAFEQILENASKARPRPEAQIEEAMIGANCYQGSPVVFLDRQVQVHGIRKKIDLVGLTPTGDIVLTEIKRSLDNRIQDLMQQVQDYWDVMCADGCLREDIANSYRNVLRQKQRLKVLPEFVSFPTSEPSVECLIVLYDYNPKSQLLGRLHHEVSRSILKPKLVHLPKGQFALPPPDEWEKL